MSPYEATTSLLLRQAGGTYIGKVNMDEFAMGSNNVISTYGPCNNPWFDPESEPSRSTGGSSGGSAAAVAADMCDFALGSDTGGSVRLPAAYCGVVGYKPSYGLLSRYGLVAYAQSFDTVGILSKDVTTAENVFNVLNKYDENDPTSLKPSVRDQILAEVAKKESKDKLTIGVVSETNLDLAPEVSEAWIKSLEYLRAQGHRIVTVSVPSIKHALPTYFVLSPSEASSNLARYDGIRYGYRAGKDREGDILYAPTRSEGFGHEVRRRIMLGAFNLSSDFFGDHYRQAQKVRRKVQQEFNTIFKTKNVLASTEMVVVGEPQEKVDVILGPTSRTQAPSHEQIYAEKGSTESYVNDVLTVPASLAGLPAITVPIGHGRETVGMQISGQFGDDKLVLQVAKSLEGVNSS